MGVFFSFLVCKKAAKAFDLLCIWILASSKLPGLEAVWVPTLRAFWGPTLLMLLDRHDDSQSCNSLFLSCTCVWGLWNEQQKCVTEMMSERRCHCYVFGSLL